MSERPARRTREAAAPTAGASPLARHLALWALFAALVVLSVFTVLVPELAEQPSDDGAANASATARAESDQPSSSDPHERTSPASSPAGATKAP
jgi:hypothetical protein